jgi:hypothetical protein
VQKCGLEARFIHLIKLRASQINGCAQLQSSFNPQGRISLDGSRRTDRGTSWLQQRGTRLVPVLLSRCPPQAGLWCSRPERRPYVRL